MPFVAQCANRHRRDVVLVHRRGRGLGVEPTHHVAVPELRRPPVAAIDRERSRPQERPAQPRLFDQLLDASVNHAQPVRLLEERVRCTVRRCEQHDLPGVRGDPQDRWRGRRERRHPHEEHAVDAVQACVECVGRGEITAHDFDVRRKVGGARIAAHGANPAAGTAQLRYHLGADVAGRAGDEDALHRRGS